MFGTLNILLKVKLMKSEMKVVGKLLNVSQNKS